MRLIWNLWNLTLFLWLHKELRLCMHKCYRLFPLLFSFIHSSLAMYTHSKKKLFLRSFMHMIFTYEILTLRSISVDCIFSFFILSVSMLSSYCFLLFSYAWFEMWCLFEDNNVSDYHLFLNRSKKRRKRSSGRNVCPLSERATFFCVQLYLHLSSISNWVMITYGKEKVYPLKIIGISLCGQSWWTSCWSTFSWKIVIGRIDWYGEGGFPLILFHCKSWGSQWAFMKKKNLYKNLFAIFQWAPWNLCRACATKLFNNPLNFPS